jgi:hypothetical protein
MKVLQNEVTETQTKSFFEPILVVNRVSSCLSFFLLRASTTTATYIFTAPTCTTTIITLDPCALNAEFQAFHTQIEINISLVWGPDSKEGG